MRRVRRCCHGAPRRPAAPLPPRDGAEVIIDALSYSHRAGTSRLACEQVFDAARCRDIDWIAGKTGTPTFPNDARSLNELKAMCKPTTGKRHKPVACGPLRPYKWYTAAWRGDPADPRWTKAIGVLTERNWIAATGRIHGAGDNGPESGGGDRDADRGAAARGDCGGGAAVTLASFRLRLRAREWLRHGVELRLWPAIGRERGCQHVFTA